MTKREVWKIVRKWQKLLDLNDWELKLEVHRGREQPQILGMCERVPERKVARISVWFPHVERRGEPADIEDTILHEMVHIYFEPFYPDGQDVKSIAARLAVEDGVVAVTSALLKLDRGK